MEEEDDITEIRIVDCDGHIPGFDDSQMEVTIEIPETLKRGTDLLLGGDLDEAAIFLAHFTQSEAVRYAERVPKGYDAQPMVTYISTKDLAMFAVTDAEGWGADPGKVITDGLEIARKGTGTEPSFVALSTDAWTSDHDPAEHESEALHDMIEKHPHLVSDAITTLFVGRTNEGEIRTIIITLPYKRGEDGSWIWNDTVRVMDSLVSHKGSEIGSDLSTVLIDYVKEHG